MKVNRVYNHPERGRMIFLRWDTYFGETTAEFKYLERPGGAWLKPSELKRLGWIE